MAIVYRAEPDGGFVCGDTITRATSYAYPTSTYATAAKRKPDRVALEMAHRARRNTVTPERAEYDARNWVRLAKVCHTVPNA